MSLHHRAKLNVEELESRIVPAITTGADYAITPSDVTIDIPVLANDFSDGPPYQSLVSHKASTELSQSTVIRSVTPPPHQDRTISRIP